MIYPIEKRTLGYILEDKAKKNFDKTFFCFEDNKFSYNDTNLYANRIANGYMSLGIKKGDKVTIMLPNCAEFVFNWFGLAKLGAVECPINIAHKGDLLRHVILTSNTKALLVHEDFIDRIIPLQNDLSCVEKVIIYAPSGKMAVAKIKFPTVMFDEFAGRGAEFSPHEKINYYDPLQIIYTSGTTGPSKGVVLPHNAMYLYAADAIESIGFNSNDVHFSCLPLYHINIRWFTIVPALLNDSRFAMVERFSASRFWDQIRKYKATNFTLLGAMVTYLLKQPSSEEHRNNPSRILQGGPMTVEQAKEFQERFNVNAFLGYFGMTEANWITSLSHKEVAALKADGKWEQALGMGKENKERYEVKLVDDFDNEVQAGEAGEVVCRPKRAFSMMTEYINMPDKTAETFRNLWFHTGDIARRDEDGFFYFVDRKKDYIRRKGENISSYEVETTVNAHSKVAESAAIGIRGEEGEEEIVIAICLKEGESLSPEELYSWCEDRMAKFMIPNYMKIMNEIPKTATGRTEKYKLRENLDKKTLTKVD